MKNFAIFYFLILYVGILFSQGDEQQYARRLSDEIDSVLIQRYRQAAPFFTEAYHLYPSVPCGMLEAVSFTYTRFVHIKPTVYQEDKNTIPFTYGLMGLTLDGRGFFRNNLHPRRGRVPFRDGSSRRDSQRTDRRCRKSEFSATGSGRR